MSLTGLLRGINREVDINRQRRQELEDRAQRDEQAILSALASNTDVEPEIRNRAATGLLELASGRSKRPRVGSFVSRLFGQDAIQPHPVVQQVYDFLQSPAGTAGAPIRVPSPDADAAVAPPPPLGSAAQPAVPASAPGGGPPSPAALGSPAGPTAGPTIPVMPPPGSLRPVPGAPRSAADLEALGTLTPQAGVQAPAQTPLTAQAPSPVQAPPAPLGPRNIFRSPEEVAVTAARAKSMGDVEGEVRGLEAAGFTPEEARGLVREKYERAARGTTGFQSIAGEMPDGTPAWGVFDRATGQYLDPNSGEPLEGFRPRTSTGSKSYGADREALALLPEYGGVPYAQATPANRARIDAELQRRVGETAYNRTLGNRQGLAAGPLSRQERATLTQTLRNNLDRYVTSYTVAKQNADVVETSWEQYKRNYTTSQPVGVQAQAIVQSFGKLLDTLSTVREAEYNRTPEGQSIMNYAKGKLDQWRIGGAGLSIEEVANIIDLSRDILKSYEQFASQQAAMTQREAQQQGLDETVIIPESLRQLIPGATPAAAAPAAAPAAAGPPPAPLQAPAAGAPRVGAFVGNPLPQGARVGTRRSDGKKVAEVPGMGIVEVRQAPDGSWVY